MQLADTRALRHSNDYYDFIVTGAEFNRLVLHRAKTITACSTAMKKTTWQLAGQIRIDISNWAPEFHYAYSLGWLFT